MSRSLIVPVTKFNIGPMKAEELIQNGRHEGLMKLEDALACQQYCLEKGHKAVILEGFNGDYFVEIPGYEVDTGLDTFDPYDYDDRFKGE